MPIAPALNHSCKIVVGQVATGPEDGYGGAGSRPKYLVIPCRFLNQKGRVRELGSGVRDRDYPVVLVPAVVEMTAGMYLIGLSRGWMCPFIVRFVYPIDNAGAFSHYRCEIEEDLSYGQ